MPELKALKGDTNIYDITVVRQKAAVNILNSKVWFTAKHSKADLDVNAVIAKNSQAHPSQVILGDVTKGKVKLVLVPNDTVSLEAPLSLYYDIQLKEADGTITTLASGILRIEPDVTYATV